MQPIFDIEQTIRLSPVLDFDEKTFYAGFMLDAQGDKGIEKHLFIKTEKGLKPIESIKTKMKEKKIPEFHRISLSLLESEENYSKDYKIFSDDEWLSLAYNDIKSKFEEYMDFTDPGTYDLLSVWCLGTYFHPLFYAYPYIHIHGLSGCGKTKTLEVACPICFNGISSGNMSTATLFRLVESGRCTLFIDETDALAKKTNVTDFREILLNGYKKFGKAWRSIKNDATDTDYTPRPYEVFCPKMLANIEGLEDVLGSRAIRVTMLRAKSNKRSEDIVPDEEKWQKTRDLCYLSLFNCWRNVKEAYNTTKNENIINRDWELWKPLLGIASLLGDDVYNNLLAYAKKSIDETFDIVSSELAEYKIVRALYRTTIKDDWIKLNDIKKFTQNEFEEGEGHWVTPHWTSKALERLGIKNLRVHNGYKQYYIRKDFIEDLMDRLKLPKDLNTLENKTISNINDKLYAFIKEKERRYVDVIDYFGKFGCESEDINKRLDMMKQSGQLFEPTPGMLRCP